MAENGNGIQTKTSKRKIEANQRNARHSTGPKTAEGKEAVRYNALKHGITAKNVIVPGDEDPAEFMALLERLVEEWKPQGVTEEWLVGETALCFFKLLRVARAEAAEIRKAKDEALQSSFAVQSTEIGDLLMRMLSSGSSSVEEPWLEPEEKLKMAEEALRELDDAGELSEDTKRSLLSKFANHHDFCRLLGEGETEPDNRLEIRTILAGQILILTQCTQAAKGERKVDVEANLAAASLPGPEALARILRYETTTTRRLHRTLKRLEEMQQRRKAENPKMPGWGRLSWANGDFAKQSQSDADYGSRSTERGPEATE